jgi:hypothetical protein
MIWIPEVRAHDQDANLTVDLSIDHRVGKVLQRVYPAMIVHGSADSWKLDQQFGHSLDLVEETARQPRPPSLR